MTICQSGWFVDGWPVTVTLTKQPRSASSGHFASSHARLHTLLFSWLSVASFCIIIHLVNNHCLRVDDWSTLSKHKEVIKNFISLV